MYKHLWIAISLAALMPAMPTYAAPILFEVGGSSDPSSIQTTVDVFRSVLGDPNNGNAPGPLPTGRREINWDGGGSTSNSPVGSPFDGFQNTRGARFITPGTGFVQAPASASGSNDDLGTFFVNPTYDATFGAFSSMRVFVPIASNITDALFYVPGTAGGTAATVSAFGAVFSDVDLLDSTKMEYFDADGNLLYSAFVEAGAVASQSLSFLGVYFDGGERISRVRITSGTGALGGSVNDDPFHGTDLVVMDDFLYSEPLQMTQVVPEPGTWALFGTGVVGLFLFPGVRRGRSRRPLHCGGDA